MIRIMVMNGLLISLILIWTSAAKEPSAGYLIKSSTKPPTGPLNYSVSKPMVSLHETNKEILRRKFLCGSELGGVCVNKKKSCPSNLPSEKSPGKPYCSKKKDRCCYPDPTTAAPPTVVPTTTTTSEDVNWSDIRNACIKSNNYKTYQPLALDICKEKCVEEDAINCQSIEYSSAQQMCAISEARSDSDDFIEPCFVDGWVFAEIELNTGPTTGAPTTLAPSNTTINGQTTNPPTTTAPSNTTNNVSSCNLVWNYEEDRPLIMIRETKTIVPPIIDIEISEDPNRIPEGKKLIFACPGENNQFNHVQGTHTKLHGECISHEQFKVCVNNYPEILDLSQLSCSSKMQPSIIKQDNDTSYEKSCEDIGGELYKFGYIYGDYREFKDLDTKFCFREKDQTTLWTSTNIDRIEISPSMRSMDPANFRTARGLAMNTFYSQKSQQETLKEILDKEVTSVWNDKACRNHGGHCVRGGRPCPKHLPHHTSQGEPFCTSFYRCCYSDQCDPSTCTYKGKKGNCSLDYLPGTTGVGSQECKKGCQCYIKDNNTSHQFKILQERKEFSKLMRGSPSDSDSDDDACGGTVSQDCNPKCQNGRTCNSKLQCDCAPGWKGKSCDIKDCNPKCQNGGTCNSNLKCDCAPGWKEKSCDIKDCNPKCQNGGTCNSNLQCDCVLGWNGKSCDIKGCDLERGSFAGHRPLVFYKTNGYNHIYHGKGFEVGVTLIFACPGEANKFKNWKDQENSFEVQCDGIDLTFEKINTDIIEKTKMNKMGCFVTYRTSIEAEITEKCGKLNVNKIQSYDKYKIGYAIYKDKQITNILPLIDICFNKEHGTTLWTHHILQGAYIKEAESKDNEPAWKNDKFPDDIKDKLSEMYKAPSQWSIFDNLLSRTDIMCNKGNRELYLVKGHMSPRSDFVTKTEQDGTYYYMNALPQWQYINGASGNWRLIERRVNALAQDPKQKRKLKIFSGGYGILEFKDKNNNNKKEIMLGKYEAIPISKVPVPAYTWKIVLDQESKKGVAFVVINNPFIDILGLYWYISYYNCDSFCTDILWLPNNYIKLDEIKKRFADPERGLTFCCGIEKFLQKFKDIGKIEEIEKLMKEGITALYS